MDEGGEMTLNLKIVKAPAKILRQLSFKLQNEISKAVYVEQLYEIHNLVTWNMFVMYPVTQKIVVRLTLGSAI